MREATQKLDDLLTMLEEKIRVTEVLNKKLSEKNIGLEDNERKMVAKARQLSARERVLGKFEDIAKEKEDAKVFMKKATEKNSEVENKEKSLVDRESDVIEKEKQLEKMIALFKKKNDSMDALKIQLETEKKLMKENILKEIQGRL